MKKRLLCLVLVSFLISGLAYAEIPDTEREILRAMDLSLPASIAKSSGTSVVLQYQSTDTCLECLASFFRKEFEKKGWEVTVKTMDKDFIKSFSDLKSKLSAAKQENQGAFPQGMDAKTAEYIVSSNNEKEIIGLIKKASPVLLEAKNKADNIVCQISIQGSLEKETAVSISFSLPPRR